MSSYIYGKVICPFFKDTKQNNPAIICEGVKDGTNLHLIFPGKAQQKDYADMFCCAGYKDCLIAKMLYEKYGGNG